MRSLGEQRWFLEHIERDRPRRWNPILGLQLAVPVAILAAVLGASVPVVVGVLLLVLAVSVLLMLRY